MKKDLFFKFFISRYAKDIISFIYNGILLRDPDSEGLNTYFKELKKTGDLSYVIQNIASSKEAWQKHFYDHSEELVRIAYRAILDRDPDPDGLAHYTNKLKEEKDFVKLLQELKESSEFIHKMTVLTRKTFVQPKTNEYDEPVIVFLHIQKTAGTTLQKLLIQAFGSSAVYYEHDDTLYYRAPAELASYSIFAGHFNYDSLRYIPRKEKKLITIVRNPKTRLESLYNFLRAHEPTHSSWIPNGGMELANKMNIEEFMLYYARIKHDVGIYNHMVWVIMGNTIWQKWKNRLSELQSDEKGKKQFLEEIRPIVRQRLSEFFWIGIQEEFDKSVGLLFEKLGIPKPEQIPTYHSLEKLMTENPNFKKSMQKQSVSVWTPEMLELIEMDNIVYEEAKNIFEKKINRREV